MKKIIFTISLCFLILALVSCSVPYRFSQDVSDPQEVSIEIVELDFIGAEHAGYDAPYSDDKVTVIRVIEEQEKEAFLSEFKKVKSYKPVVGEPIFHLQGTAIRITYSNGDFDLITDFGVGRMWGDELRIETTTFDSDEFNALINKYYPEIESSTVYGAQIRDGYAILPLCSTLEALGFELTRDGNGGVSFACNGGEYFISLEEKTLTAKGSDENYLICPPGNTSFVCEAVDGDLMVDENTVEPLFYTFLNYPIQVYISGDRVLVIKR